MTKEGYKIFWEKAQYLFDEHEMDITGLTEAADEYAKQEAIDFLKWKEDFISECVISWDENDSPVYEEINKIKGNLKFTPEQLYQLYLESKNKQQ